jgi:hypothetical protein
MSSKLVPAMTREDRLRQWVHQRYGRWITHATAHQALKFILTEPFAADMRKDWEKTRDASS